jgi:hypothetical protein
MGLNLALVEKGAKNRGRVWGAGRVVSGQKEKRGEKMRTKEIRSTLK